MHRRPHPTLLDLHCVRDEHCHHCHLYCLPPDSHTLIAPLDNPNNRRQSPLLRPLYLLVINALDPALAPSATGHQIVRSPRLLAASQGDEELE